MENVSKYLDDKRFIQWIFNPNDKLETWWKTYETHHLQEKQNIQLARNILLKLVTNDKTLSDKEKIVIFSRILKQIEEKQKSRKTILFFTSLLKYAAVAILFFSIGAILFYQQHNYSPQFYSQNLVETNDFSEAKLIRPNGENILLEEKNSIIEYTETGQVKVNKNILKPFHSTEKRIPKLNQLIIPFGKTSEILLSDGTKVWLNAGSRLVYPDFFDDKNREVFLTGEAFFDVKHDKKHPFIVQTTDIRIKVLGTQFNISAYPSDNIIETVLTEGRVNLELNNSGLFSETTELKPSQLAAFNKTTGETKTLTVDTDNYTLWKEGVFKFEGTDLCRISKKLERFYNIRFYYKNSLQGRIKISGKLDLNEEREEIINRLAVAASIKIVKKGENNYEIN